jgi:hypothetical protein
MNSNGVLNSNRFVEKLGIQMLLRNVVIYMLLFTHNVINLRDCCLLNRQ